MWQLRENIASYRADPFRIQVNTARPGEGVRSICCGTAELPICPFQISARPPLGGESEPIDEVYVRGDDLIVTYQLASQRSAWPQVVWTATVDEDVLAVDATIAMQTPWLASDPSLTSVTSGTVGEVLIAVGTADRFEFQDATVDVRQACGLFLFRLPAGDYSYAEMVYPPDFDVRQLKYEDGRLEYRLICEELEKGVIRKAQLRGMVIPRQRDIQIASDGFRSLRSSAPPLTT